MKKIITLLVVFIIVMCTTLVYGNGIKGNERNIRDIYKIVIKIKNEKLKNFDYGIFINKNIDK